MSTLISFKKCKSLEIKSLLTSLLRQGDTMEIVLNEILPQWFLTDAITTYNHSDCELKFYIDKVRRQNLNLTYNL